MKPRAFSDDLDRGCQGGDPNPRTHQVGEPAIEFSLRDMDGNEYVLSELESEKPVYEIFGSFI